MDELLGRRYSGALTVSPERVAEFVAATGDDEVRWRDYAPPGFAAAVLFTVAPLLLADADFAGVIHTEQRFEWAQAFAAGDELEVVGTVESVRGRSGLVIVGFTAAATRGGETIVASHSTFLMSSAGLGAVDPEQEPGSSERAANDVPSSEQLPAVEEVVPILRKSASRSDLMRYAKASGDLNPIHTDHGAAVAAGLPGVIVHGLLMVSWMAQQASRFVDGSLPIADLRARFKKPLRPSVQAVIEGSVGETDLQAAKMALTLSSADVELVTAVATIRVTP